MTSEKRFEPRYPGDFWSQAPVVLFAAAAVLAILLVNVRSQSARVAATPPAEARATVPATAAAQGAASTATCGDCGVVIAIEPAAAPGGDGEAAIAVRMGDGRLVTVRQVSPAVAVGDAVHVNGDVLVAGN